MPAESLVQRYRDQLQKLMPPGVALNRRLGSFLTEWLEAFSVEFARIHERSDDMVREAYPGESVELLEDWETLTGLPDECSYGATTDEQRQAAVLSQFAVTEGQSLADFQLIATLRGYPSLTMGTYGNFRTAVHPIGHKPIYSDEWLFGSRVSYEVASPADSLADDALECALLRHAHIHTQMNFNPWDTAPVASLSGLRHHFVAGEYVTHADGDDTIIDFWTNRSTGDDITNGARADAVSARVISVEGWSAADLGEDAASIRGLDALTVADAAGPGALLKHGDFQLFAAVRLSALSSPDSLLKSTSFDLYVATAAGLPISFRFIYGTGGPITRDAGLGRVFVLSCACDGVNSYLRLNDGTATSAASTPASGTESLVLGDAFQGSVLEIITSEFTGIPGSETTVDAVTDYLIAKYL